MTYDLLKAIADVRDGARFATRRGAQHVLEHAHQCGPSVFMQSASPQCFAPQKKTAVHASEIQRVGHDIKSEHSVGIEIPTVRPVAQSALHRSHHMLDVICLGVSQSRSLPAFDCATDDVGNGINPREMRSSTTRAR
jgi:hypothetical protein